MRRPVIFFPWPVHLALSKTNNCKLHSLARYTSVSGWRETYTVWSPDHGQLHKQHSIANFSLLGAQRDSTLASENLTLSFSLSGFMYKLNGHGDTPAGGDRASERSVYMPLAYERRTAYMHNASCILCVHRGYFIITDGDDRTVSRATRKNRRTGGHALAVVERGPYMHKGGRRGWRMGSGGKGQRHCAVPRP